MKMERLFDRREASKNSGGVCPDNWNTLNITNFWMVMLSFSYPSRMYIVSPETNLPHPSPTFFFSCTYSDVPSAK